jgi:hypothetical protein
VRADTGLRWKPNPMSALLVGLIVFVLASGAGLAGIFIHGILPAHHKEADSKEVVKLVMGLIATIAALVLSLLIATANSSYQTQEAEVQTLGVRIVQLDRILEDYGPEAQEARAMLRQIVANELDQIWPKNGGAGVNLRAPLERSAGDQLIGRIANLVPTTDAHRLARTRALDILSAIGETRRLLYEQADGSRSWPFFVILVFWVCVLFLGFGFLTRPNATVVTALFVGALSVAGAIFLILEMNRPYSGLMQISSAPIRTALAAISH